MRSKKYSSTLSSSRLINCSLLSRLRFLPPSSSSSSTLFRLNFFSTTDDNDDEKKDRKEKRRKAIGAMHASENTKNKNAYKQEFFTHDAIQDPLFESKLNGNPDVLSFKNGVLNLRDGTFRGRRYDDYLSKCLDRLQWARKPHFLPDAQIAQGFLWSS